MRGSIKRTIATSTIHVARINDQLQVEKVEPIVSTGDFSDKEKAQKHVNMKHTGLTVLSVDVEKATYALSAKKFMEYAELVQDDNEASETEEA